MVYRLFTVGLKQIRRDGMLLFLLPAPFLIGMVFRFLLPWADRILRREFSLTLEPWYQLSDAFLIVATPSIVAAISGLLILEELDEGLNLYYTVTPAGGRKYLTARLLIPMLWAFPCSVLVLVLFSLTAISWWQLLITAFLGTVFGGTLGIMVVSFAQNKVEGLAYTKLTGAFSVGLPVVWLFRPPYQYLAAWLPSFWIGKILVELKPTTVFIGILVTFGWAIIFWKRFLTKTIV